MMHDERYDERNETKTAPPFSISFGPAFFLRDEFRATPIFNMKFSSATSSGARTHACPINSEITMLARLTRGVRPLAPRRAPCRALCDAKAAPASEQVDTPPSGDAAPPQPSTGLHTARRVLKLPTPTIGPRGSSGRGSAVRIDDFTIPPQRRLIQGLRSIFGVGYYQATRLAAHARLNPNLKVRQLDNSDIERLTTALRALSSDEANEDAEHRNVLVVGQRLAEQYGVNIDNLKNSGLYRGERHRLGLPLKARTKTNARTARRRPRYPLPGSSS